MAACEICNLKLSNKTSLLNHKSVVHDLVGRHQCKVCDKYFHITADYKNHVRSDMGERTYKCSAEDCDKTFVTASNRTHHEAVHNLEKKSICIQCSKSYN